MVLNGRVGNKQQTTHIEEKASRWSWRSFLLRATSLAR
jgi:hypothetical protein